MTAVQAQNTVNPAGKVGGEPAPKGQEFTTTVLAQGRLISPEDFGNIVVRETPGGGTVRVHDVARIELGAQDYSSAGRFDASQGSDKVFIAMITRRRLIDRLRKTSAEPPMDSVDALETVAWADPGTAPEISSEVEQATRALAELRPEQRQVLELGLMHGLSQSEIAARLGMPLGTVKSFMRRGLIKVREYLNVDAPSVSARV